MWHVWETGEVRIGLWCEDLWERDHLEDLVLDVRIILNWILKKWELLWIGIWTGDACF